jgi:RNA recognition motif-containing protein
VCFAGRGYRIKKKFGTPVVHLMGTPHRATPAPWIPQPMPPPPIPQGMSPSALAARTGTTPTGTAFPAPTGISRMSPAPMMAASRVNLIPPPPAPAIFSAPTPLAPLFAAPAVPSANFVPQPPPPIAPALASGAVSLQAPLIAPRRLPVPSSLSVSFSLKSFHLVFNILQKPTLQVGVKVLVSRIPKSVDDKFLSVLFEQCGNLLEWSRMENPVTKKLVSFGFCRYDNPAGALTAIKLLNGAELGGSRLLVAVDKATGETLEKFVADLKDPLSKVMQTDRSATAVLDEEDNMRRTVINKLLMERKKKADESNYPRKSEKSHFNDDKRSSHRESSRSKSHPKDEDRYHSGSRHRDDDYYSSRHSSSSRGSHRDRDDRRRSSRDKREKEESEEGSISSEEEYRHRSSHRSDRSRRSSERRDRHRSKSSESNRRDHVLLLLDIWT